MGRGLGVVTLSAGLLVSGLAAAAGELPPDAKVTTVRGDATTLTPAPTPAKADAPLRRGDRVRTEAGATVGVAFADGSGVTIGEKTLVTIGLGTATLSSGSLVTGDAGGAKAPVVATTDGARIVAGTSTTRVTFDDKKVTRVAVYGGAPVTVTAQKKDAVVNPSFGVVIEPGKAPAAPRALPGMPAWVTAPLIVFTSGATANVDASYQRGTTGDAPVRYHVQVARDPVFAMRVADAEVPATSTRVDPKILAPVGPYSLRVSAIDADGFEGPFSPVAQVRVVSTAPAAGWTQEIPIGLPLLGLTCAIDGAAPAAVAADASLDRFHSHDLRCSTTADGPLSAPVHLTAEPFTLTWSLANANAHAHTAILRATAKDTAGHAVDHVTLAVANANGVDVDVFTSEDHGVYAAKIGWNPGTTQLAAKVAANGEAHGDVALALPIEAGDQDVVPLPPKDVVPTTFGELGIEAGFTGAAPGIGPLVGFRGGVRQDMGRVELSVNAIFSMEARAADETGALPLGLTGGAIVSSYSTSERVYVVGVPLEARYKLGKSPFSAGIGVTPFFAFENANVSYFGGNVSLRSPNTLFGANLLAVGHLVAGPGTIVLGAGVRFSTTRDREVVDVNLFGPYVSLGYRLAL